MVEMSKKWVKTQIHHIPNAKEASKYPFPNNNDAPSVTKYGFLLRPHAPK